MEQTIQTVKKEPILLKLLLPILLVLGLAFAMVIIVYGIDSIVPGAHDTFHDFRHVFGIPCH